MRTHETAHKTAHNTPNKTVHKTADKTQDNSQDSVETCVVHLCQGQAISNGRGDEGGTKGVTRGKGKKTPSGQKEFHTQKDSIQQYNRGIILGHKSFHTQNDSKQQYNRKIL